MNTQEIKQLKEQLKNAEEQRKSNIARIVGINEKQVLAYDNRIIFKANNLKEVAQIMDKWKPFKNSQEIRFSGKPSIFITSLFKVSIRNNYYNRTLNFDYENLNGDKCTIEIDFRNFDLEVFNGLIYKTVRPLVDSETVYVNIPSHYKKFKDIRVEAFRFRGQNVSYYGGDTVLTCEEGIRQILEIIKGL